MTEQSDSPALDEAIAALADAQYGVVAYRQLVEVGLGEDGIAARLRTGRLHRVHRGVHSVGHRSLRREGYWMAAVLACGPGAVLSHRSAAALWALRSGAGSAVDVTVPSNGGRHRRRGIRVHRSRRLAPEEVTVELGISVTTVARTLLDLADVLQVHALKRAVAEAEYRGLFDLMALSAVVAHNPGRRGATLVRAIDAHPQRTRSDLENRFLDLIDRHGLPRPTAGLFVGGHETDFAWPRAKLIVETDGHAAHRTEQAFEADRLRDRDTLRAGFRTIRLTGEAMADEAAVARDLAAQLGA